MSANLLIEDIRYHSQEQDKVIDSALDLIMPSWPLDQSVAVNPWHSQTDKNDQCQVFSCLARLCQNIIFLYFTFFK